MSLGGWLRLQRWWPPRAAGAPGLHRWAACSSLPDGDIFHAVPPTRRGIVPAFQKCFPVEKESERRGGVGGRHGEHHRWPPHRVSNRSHRLAGGEGGVWVWGGRFRGWWIRGSIRTSEQPDHDSPQWRLKNSSRLWGKTAAAGPGDGGRLWSARSVKITRSDVWLFFFFFFLF